MTPEEQLIQLRIKLEKLEQAIIQAMIDGKPRGVIKAMQDELRELEIKIDNLANGGR